MDTRERRRLDTTALAMKQASVARTIAVANAAYKNGTMRTLPLPEGVQVPPPRALRVKSTHSLA